jgi:glycosyltransferase involved in cell wall biosynthesis
MTETPLVTVIVPTFNSEGTLVKCLDSIKNQTYTNIEVIIVDKSSTDRTVETSMSYVARIYVVDAKERSEQINYGFTKSSGEYVYRVDSDFVLDSKVIEEAVMKCEKENLDALCIHNTSDPTISFWSRVRKLERDMYRDDNLNVAARFFRRRAFEQVGGFNENLVASEDYDIHNRLIKAGFRVGRIRAQETHIGEPRTLGEIARKHFYYGKTVGKFINANPGIGARQLNPVRKVFIKNWRQFAENPVLSAGFVIYQIVRYGSSVLGFAVGRVQA